MLTVQEIIPVWRTIPSQSVEAGARILIGLVGFVDNDPDSFALVSKNPSDSSAPDLPITVNSITGLLSGTAPSPEAIEQDRTYSIVVSCQNSAGKATPDGMFDLTVTLPPPNFTGGTTFSMDEGTTAAFNIGAYMDPDSVVDDYAITAPTLTTSHGTPAPTLTAAIIPPADSGLIRATASDVPGDADALFTFTATARNNTAVETQRDTQLFTIRVNNVTNTPVFDLCQDQEVNEFRPIGFNVSARSNLTITYSRVSGPSWANINSSTGRVTGTAPEVDGTLAGNPSDTYTAVFRASVTNSAVSPPVTETADCSVNITVFNVDVPTVDTAPTWGDIPNYNYLERKDFSFNISPYATASNPAPIFGLPTDVEYPIDVSISQKRSGEW